VIAGVIAATAVLAAAASAQRVQTFTVIDRTMVCTTAFSGGAPDRVRTVRISGETVRGEGEAQFPAAVHASTGDTDSFAGLVSVETGELSGRQPAVLFNHRRCVRVKTRLPVTRQQRAARPVDFTAGCEVFDAPPKVVIRLRAVMQVPTRWRRYRDVGGAPYTRAAGRALEALVAVSTHPAQRPLGFASLDREGSARFFRTPR
jgi:hypothetical protein